MVNHLLLGKKAIAAQHPCKNGIAHGLLLPKAQSTPTQDHSLQSPWRAHVCAHRRNLARARAQLGFDDSVELEDKTSPKHKTKSEEGEENMKEKEEEDKEKERQDSSECQDKDLPLPEPVQEIIEEEESELQLHGADCTEEVQELEEQLSSLDLDSSAQASSELNDPETPSSVSEPELGGTTQPHFQPNVQQYVSAVECSTRHDSSSSDSTASSLKESPSVASTPEVLPKSQQIFSPFPCVKVPRKSMAARNLGLYGPTSRTPNVHFPHMSKSMNRMGAGIAVSTRRR